MATILVAEDEPVVRELLASILRARGFDVVAAADGQEALAKLGEQEFDVVLSDIKMPGVDGVEVLEASKQVAPDTEVVIASAVTNLGGPSDWMTRGAFDYVRKPYTLADLLATVDRALERRQLRTANALYQASRAILDAREPNELPRVIVDVACKAMAADDVVLLLPGHADCLYPACSTALTPRIREDVHRTVDLRICRTTPPRDPRIESDATVLSSITYPLWASERLVGVLAISRVINTRPFRKLDLEKAGVIASQIVLALENMRLARHTIAAERLATVGQVATSIAHEINNPISYMLASQAHLREQLVHVVALCDLIGRGADAAVLQQAFERIGGATFADDLLQAADDVRDGAERVRDILRDTRSLAHQEDRAEPFDVNEAIRSALRVVAAEVRHKAVISTTFGDDVQVSGSAGRLAQVFVNLLVNAAEAFGDGLNNAITVVSRRAGDHVVVTIRDNGPGIAAVHLPRIFETYYSTKTSPVATGLGLPISRDIVRRYGGDIAVDSHPGAGATFTIVLPRAAKPRSKPATLSAPHAATLGTPLRLLFVDDEPNILRSYRRAFAASHDIVLAPDGEQALAAIRTRSDFDLIVCDLSMPTMSGMQLYAAIGELEPALLPRIVFATGGATQRDIEQFLSSIPNVVLEKPFDMTLLRQLVADLQPVA